MEEFRKKLDESIAEFCNAHAGKDIDTGGLHLLGRHCASFMLSQVLEFLRSDEAYKDKPDHASRVAACNAGVDLADLIERRFKVEDK
jgi:hypothetical protein